MENSDLETDGSINRDDAEDMVSDDSSDSVDSEKEREEHYKLERRVVELRKEVRNLGHSLSLSF